VGGGVRQREKERLCSHILVIDTDRQTNVHTPIYAHRKNADTRPSAGRVRSSR